MQTRRHHRGPQAAVEASRVPLPPPKEVIGVCAGCRRMHDRETNEWLDVWFLSAGKNQTVSNGLCGKCATFFMDKWGKHGR